MVEKKGTLVSYNGMIIGGCTSVYVDKLGARGRILVSRFLCRHLCW